MAWVDESAPQGGNPVWDARAATEFHLSSPVLYDVDPLLQRIGSLDVSLWEFDPDSLPTHLSLEAPRLRLGQ